MANVKTIGVEASDAFSFTGAHRFTSVEQLKKLLLHAMKVTGRAHLHGR